MRKLILLLAGILCANPLYAETVYLKSGKAVQGKIIGKTDTAVTLDLFDVPITYFKDEIERIEEDAQSPALESPSATGTLGTSLTRDDLEEVFTINAQPAQEISPQKVFLENNKCLLWKLQSSNAVMYLLGSIHLLKKEQFPLDTRIEKAFASSDILVTEVNVTKEDLLMMTSSMMSEAVYQGDDTLKEHISSDTYEGLAKKLASLGLEISLFDKFKPWFVAIQLTATQLMKLGFDPNFGTDRYFLEKAQQKQVLELETHDFQVKLLSSLSQQQQELLLRSALMDLDTIEREMGSIITAWMSGDEKRLGDLLLGNFIQHPEMAPVFDKVFLQRNRTMASKIEAMINNGGSYFVIVGAGHLVGKGGIVQLLQAKGFSVSQL